MDTFWTVLRPCDHGFAHHRKIVFEQDQIGGRTRDIGGAVDRDPDIGGVQRRRVVDAVAHEADDMAEPLQRQQDAMLLLRVDAAEQIDPRQLPDQRLVREMRQRVAGQHAGDRHADLGEDVAGHEFVVAGQHLHGDARSRHRLDRRPGAGLRRIEENGEAGEDKIALVGDRGGLVARVDRAAGDAEGAEALRAERVEGGLEGAARLGVERLLRSVRGLVPPGQPQQILRRALDDQTALGVVLDQDRDAPPLEIERHLVDLLPAGHVERMGGEDRLVERALHAAFEPAVDVGVGDRRAALSAPRPSIARTSLIVASVSVPVLSVHSTSMAPRSWIADRRFTITLRLASSIADRASVTVTIIGSSSGVSPTASASANISDSSTGRWNEMFTTRTNSTINTVRRMISMPNRRMPTAKAVAGGFSARLVARWPSAVSAAGSADDDRCGAADHRGAGKDGVRCAGGVFGARRRVAGLLLGRVRLAGQERLVDEQIAAFEQPRVRRNEIAGDQLDDVAGDQLVDRHREACAVAPHGCLHRHRPAQRLDRILRADFLDEIERHADRDDG